MANDWNAYEVAGFHEKPYRRTALIEAVQPAVQGTS